jgi:divalent metal cation (Fe/Co/Zn/Cd) transporter
MEPLIQTQPTVVTVAAPPAHRKVLLLQIITLGWMLIELLVAAFASYRSHSVVLLAFGSDSFVELLSAGVVLLQFNAGFHLSRDKAAKISGFLLYLLAGIVGFIAVASMLRGVKAESSIRGIAITTGALLIMPILAHQKRRLALQTNDRALASDAVQSATCAYLAAITLVSLALQAFHPTRWVDPLASFCAIPILIVEGQRARRGDGCGCC